MVEYNPWGGLQQGLGNLGAALFPDPTKMAAAGYYGAQQREAMLKGNQLIDQGNANNAGLALTPDSGLTPQSPRFFVPSGSPQGAPPVMAPATNLPMVGGGQPSLSATVTAPPGGAPPPAPTMPPAQLANLFTHGTQPNPQGVGTAGTPSDASSPAPNSGAPPAPTTTGSDGSVPSNDAQSAALHPGSLQAPGGGIKYAPPAQSDGSPAPIAFNPALYTAMMTRAGYNADQVRNMGAAYVMQAWRQGIIDEPTANKLWAGFGQTGALTAQTQITTTGMTIAGENLRQGMVTGEQRREFDMTPVMTTPGGPGTPPVYTPRSQAAGQPAYDAPFSADYNKPVLTQPGGPTAPPVYQRQGTLTPGTPGYDATFGTNYSQPTEVAGPGDRKVIIRRGEIPAGGAAAYSPEREKLALTPVLVIDPNDKGQLKTVSAADFNKGGYIRAPDNLNVPPAEINSLQDTVDNRMARIYAPPPVDVTDRAWLSPARAEGEDNARLLSLTKQLLLTSPDSSIRGNPAAAADAAITQGQQEGWLPSPQEAAEQRTHFIAGKEAMMKQHIFQMQDPTGKSTGTYYLLPKKTPNLSKTVAPAPAAPPPQGAPTAAAPGSPPASTTTLKPWLSSIFGQPFTPAASAAPAALPPGAVGMAPQGTPDGTPATSSSGRAGVVRGGFIYPAPQQGQGG